MRACWIVLWVALVIVTCAWSRRGAAQSGGAKLPESYLAIKAGVGLAGSLSAHNDAYSLTQPNDANPLVIPERDSGSDLETSFGGEAQYMFSLHRLLALGASLGVRAWRSASGKLANEGMNANFDFGAVPQLRLPLSESLELYVSVPLSFVLSVLSEYKTWSEFQHETLGTARSVSPTYGFGVGVLAGARFAIIGHFGLLAELGYQRYAFTHSVQFQVLEEHDSMGLGTTLGVDLVTEQVRVNAGVFF